MFCKFLLALYGNFHQFLPRNLVGRLITLNRVFGRYTRFYDPVKKEIVYQATVNSKGGETETYVGLTANTFKKRHSGHTFNFKHEDSKGTTLSAYIWKLKNQNKNY